MDSLGGLHTAIVDVLRSWLSFEALDKKGRPLDHSPEALHVNVSVKVLVLLVGLIISSGPISTKWF